MTKKTGVYGEVGTILIDYSTHAILGTTRKAEVLDLAEAF